MGTLRKRKSRDATFLRGCAALATLRTTIVVPAARDAVASGGR
jgi:hypothetical protein